MSPEKWMPQSLQLVDFWYGILNFETAEGSRRALQFLSESLQEDGVSLEEYIELSEKSGDPLVRSICYGALKMAGRELTPEQEKYLRENPWQNRFWRY
ncbi:hypothetical protein HY408_00480 [Candidatus Gottesmanbacteria bacterium]|nr:hypothetical protein [Candidatus Gottesmanbacteria bacterium]